MARSSSDAGSRGVFESLAGHVLIAMPGLFDEHFSETIVLLCTHSPEGAMGLIINRDAPGMTFDALAKHLDLLDRRKSRAGDRISGEARPKSAVQRCPIQTGGPVEPSRGFVLHSPDYFATGSTVPVVDGVCLTATVDILRALAQGTGPKQAILALGYAAWDSGQLESELQANGWLYTEATADLVFGTALEQRYSAAFTALGIDPSFLVTEGGHA